MSREFKRTVFTILLLIPLTLLIPNTGFGGGEPPTPCIPEEHDYVPPVYIGNLTAEWKPECTLGNWCVLMYGVLKNVESHYKIHRNDIVIKKKEQFFITDKTSQTDFLKLESQDLRGIQFSWLNTCYEVLSANDLDHKTGTLFTVDVVVMEIRSAPQ